MKMKGKYKLLALLALLIVYFVPLKAHAETYDSYEYVITGDTVTLSLLPDCDDDDDYVLSSIPAQIRGIPGITKLILNEGFTAIDDDALSDCRYLTSIELPQSVTRIGSSAFSGCSSLTSIDIPSGVTLIRFETFKGCSSLTSINIPSGVTSIESYAFEECSDLAEVTIPDSVHKIDSGAFWGCSSLNNVVIPESVIYIGWNAFYDCLNLTTIDLPFRFKRKSLGIPEEATITYFDESKYDNYIYSIDGDTITITSDSIDNTELFLFLDDIVNDGSVSKLIIGEGFTKICAKAFEDCTDLKIVEVPDSVTEIEESAFAGCEDLEKIELPNTVHKIGSYAFEGCSSLKSIDIPDIVTEISDFTFVACESLTSIKIPVGVISIGTGAFADCSGLVSVEIPEGVTDINQSAFEGCIHLTSVDIPASVRSLGLDAFSRCSDLTSVLLHEGLSSIEASAFSYCSNLTSINIPKSVDTIGQCAFSDCTKLTSIELQEGLKTIRYGAFSDCKSLATIKIPDSVTTLSADIFMDSGSLTDVTIPLRFYDDNEEFGLSDKINIKFLEKHDNYDCNVVKDKATLVLTSSNTKLLDAPVLPSEITEVDIDNRVTDIGEHFFSHDDSLISIKLPTNLVTIGRFAFEWCDDLRSISIPNGVKSIGERAFIGCKSIINMDIPESATTLGSDIFKDCTNLTSVSLPVKFKSEIESRTLDLGIDPTKITYYGAKCAHANKTKTVSDYYRVSPASCTSPAVYFYACKDCSKVLSEKYTYGSALGHKESQSKTCATISKDGSIVKKCDRCQAVLSTKKIPRAYITVEKSAKYTGSAIKHPVKIVDKSGKSIPKTNYTLTYKDNTKIGVATVTVTFKNDYSGSKSYKFDIVPRAISIAKVKAGKKMLTVTWKQTKDDITGYEIAYSTSSDFKTSVKTVTIKSKKETSKTIKSLKTGKTYYVRIRTYKTVGSKKYVSDWSKASKIKVK